MKKDKIGLFIAAFTEIAIFVVTVFTVTTFFTGSGDGNMQVSGFTAFRYFTIDSNVLAALMALVGAVYKLRALSGKSGFVPAPVKALMYAGVCSVCVTFMTVLFFLVQVYGFAMMYLGANMWLHLLGPLLSLAAFVLFESDREFDFSLSPVSVLPTLIYGAVYLTMVVFIGKENGGWEDFYAFNVGGKWYISLLIMTAATYAIGAGVLLLHNLASRRKNAGKRVLVTAFEPFGKDSYNPSAAMLKALPGREGVIKAVLPTEYAGAGEKLTSLIRRYKPRAVICTGVAGGRDAVCIEKRAVNIRSASLPDNAGVTMSGQPVVAGLEAELFTGFDAEKTAEEINKLGIPCRVSQDAGTFVCNSTYYLLLRSAKRGVFVHIPYDEKAVAGKGGDLPFLPLSESVKALSVVIKNI